MFQDILYSLDWLVRSREVGVIKKVWWCGLGDLRVQSAVLGADH